MKSAFFVCETKKGEQKDWKTEMKIKFKYVDPKFRGD